MTKEMDVSLWLGNTYEGWLQVYVDVEYWSEEPHYSSEFTLDFDIDATKLDEDFFEGRWTPEGSDDLSVLLKRFSYDEEVIQAFKELTGGKLSKKYNTVILIYDFKHHGGGHSDKFDYIGSVRISCKD